MLPDCRDGVLEKESSHRSYCSAFSDTEHFKGTLPLPFRDPDSAACAVWSPCPQNIFRPFAAGKGEKLHGTARRK
jgi:hypothetical protein